MGQALRYEPGPAAPIPETWLCRSSPGVQHSHDIVMVSSLELASTRQSTLIPSELEGSAMSSALKVTTSVRSCVMFRGSFALQKTEALECSGSCKETQGQFLFQSAAQATKATKATRCQVSKFLRSRGIWTWGKGRGPDLRPRNDIQALQGLLCCLFGKLGYWGK